MLAACAQQDAKFPAPALPWHPGQQLSLVAIPGDTFPASGITQSSAHEGIARAHHAGVSHRAQGTGVPWGPAHRGVTWGSAQPGITQGTSHWPCCAAGLRASPWGPLFALRGGVDLQAVPSVWPCVHGFVWFSSPTPGCLQTPMAEETLPDLLTPGASALTLSWLDALVPCLPHSCVDQKTAACRTI